MGNGVAQKMTEDRIKHVQTLVRDADYKGCPVPRQREVQEFLVDGVACLIAGQKMAPADIPPKSWKEWWWEFSIRAPYAGVLFIIAVLAFYYLATGSFPFVGEIRAVDTARAAVISE